MESSLDEQYLTWLYARIGSVKETRKSRTYWSLFRYLYQQEFVWIVPNDDNRVEDGRYLRYEFLDENELSSEVDPAWLHAGCSVLEMIFGVANRLTFQVDRTPLHWFWELMNNLGLSGYNDREFDAQHVAEVTNNLIFRTYAPDGVGGLFPLEHPPNDQREVEIWYQMSLYIQERH